MYVVNAMVFGCRCLVGFYHLALSSSGRILSSPRPTGGFIKKEHLVAVFFDLEKAYDTTWKYGIMNDLQEIGLKGRLPLFISYVLNDRQFKVRVGATLSDMRDQEMGVPQGSILSVTLFNVKINNIVKSISPGTDCSLYVDDF